MSATRDAHRRIVSVICALLIAPWVTNASAGDRHALMVAVTRPIALRDAETLDGVHNDVAAMRQLALRWGVSAQRLTVLESGSSSEPTYAAVQTAMRELLLRLRRGDEVLLYLTGHGSQQPVVGIKPDPDEDDGLDEVFLLADSRPERAPAQRFVNALVDNEVGAWLDAATARGVFVWLVVDACHSGTFERGGAKPSVAEDEFDPVTVKRVSGDLLGPLHQLARKRDPEKRLWHTVLKRRKTDVVSGPRKSTSGAGSAAIGSSPSGDAPDPAFVGFYAVEANEDASEVRIRKTGKPVSLFSHLLVQAFDEVVARDGKQAVSFEQLAMSIYAKYGQLRRRYPLPEFVGNDWSRPVMARSGSAKKRVGAR